MVKQMKVLVVDDDRVARETLIHILESVDRFDVIAWAKNGEDAIESLAAFAGGFDLIITDINMPIMGGLQLIKEVRANYNSCQKFIVVSGGLSQKDRGVLAEFDLSGHILAKPYNIDRLIVMIDKVLSELNYLA
ncbi:MAG: hypothetical protein COS76_00755 [Candidatus Portnoybacteria bacterium CG06_land_8_20_14_3_00_39_12]|uniref:Response regulatory domain-containing protein n=3 Tax=Candidatus Portnoyibacteriota TaxID=1817913 RepID=A0A2M7UIK9_9BACT|nr:MAG: hypothetical protein COS76_00755 [Candidatus Portnoybacteria bacterium CG06_land_8_20_14_3_00_39_12]PIZ71073.1 MAG: hypothetical protein COY09_01395 [Candidatus Portnoybacteria bacterium CG_4_10_14_0_2_um_filter_39_11]